MATSTRRQSSSDWAWRQTDLFALAVPATPQRKKSISCSLQYANYNSVSTTTTLMNGRARLRRARATPHYIEEAINEYDRNSGKPLALSRQKYARRGVGRTVRQ